MRANLNIANYWQGAPQQRPAPTFTPASVTSATLVSYIDAENNSKIINVSGACSQITDSADATGIYVQATANARPLIQVNSLTGRQVLQFDGVNDNLRMATFPALLPLTGSIDVWFIGTQEATDATNRQQYSYGNGLVTGSLLVQRLAVSNRFQCTISNGTTGFTATTPNSLFVGTSQGRMYFNGTNLQAAINGINGNVFAASFTIAAGGRVTLGATSASTPTGFHQGAISAILVYNNVMSVNDANNLAIWCAQRLGKAVS